VAPAQPAETRLELGNEGSEFTSPEDEWVDVIDKVRLHPLTVHTEHYADRLGLIELVQATRLGRYATGLVARAHKVMDAGEIDLVASESRVADRWVRRTTIYSQTADRFRLFMILASNAALDAYEWSEDGRWAGAAAGVAFMGWTALVGESLTQTYERHPKLVEAVQEEFPVAVDMMADALPGTKQRNELAANQSEVEVQEVDETVLAMESIDKVHHLDRKTLQRIALTTVTLPLNLLRRGFSSVNFGATAYVSTTKFQGGSKAEQRRQYAEVAGFGGAFCFGLAWGATEWINHLAEEGHYEQAQTWLDRIGSDLNWFMLGAVSIATELTAARFRGRKMQKMGRITGENEVITQPDIQATA